MKLCNWLCGVSTWMVSTLHSVCELLLSRKHDYDIFSLYQERTVIYSVLIWAKGKKLLKFTHTFMCSVQGQCFFLEKCLQVDRNVQGSP